MIEALILEVEALIFASETPIQKSVIANIVFAEFANQEENLFNLDEALNGIVEKYQTNFYPFEVKELGGGYQFLTKNNFYNTVNKLNADKFTKKLSTAAMETLAIIAYKQPITKPEIEHIRGVNSDYSVQKLLEKELIVISGRNEEMVGKPLIYGTTKYFTDYLGIASVDALPKLKELALAEVEPTLAIEAVPENPNLAIDENGDLIELDNQA